MTPQELQDAIIKHALELQRLSAHEEREALDIIRQMEDELKQLLAVTDLETAKVREINKLIADAENAISGHYKDINAALDTHDLINLVAEKTTEALNQLRPAIMPTPERLASLANSVLIDGAPTAAWWAKQAEDTAFRFASAVRAGKLLGETQEQIVARIVGRGDEPGILDLSRRHARTLVHSSIMSAANFARLETYRKNMADGDTLYWLATLDGHVCKQCLALDGSQWDRDGNKVGDTVVDWNGGPPAHPNCRCTLSLKPGMKGLRALLGDKRIDEAINAGGRASALGPTGDDRSMAGFLKRLSKAEQDSILGVGRADLWRKGKITLRDLVSGTGRELSLKELRSL